MPPLEPEDLCRDYLNVLFDIGPVQPGFSGAQALSWGELDAYCRLSSETLSAAEARLLRTLSSVYASAVQDAAEPDATSPWLESQQDHVDKRAASAEQGLAAAFRSMTKKSR